MAMQSEAQPVIRAMNLQESPKDTIVDGHLPMQCYQGQHNGINISLFVSGLDERYGVDNIGSEAATLMAHEAIIKVSPDLLISAGTAGGFKKRGATIGTVYLSDKYFIYHDRRVPLPGFDESAIGKYPATPVSGLAKHLNVKQGIISTGSSLQKNPEDVTVIEEHQAVAKEMEAAAIAWVAYLYRLPIIGLKSITNVLDEENKSEAEFVKNLELASLKLQEKLIALIQYLPGKTLDDLA